MNATYVPNPASALIEKAYKQSNLALFRAIHAPERAGHP
jgi:hypothetical protein